MSAYSPVSLEALHLNRDSLMAVLAKLNVTDVIIHYDGGGDSGDVSDVLVKPETLMPQLAVEQMTHRYVVSDYHDGEYHFHLAERQLSVDDALRDFTLTWLEAQHGGWENNDGGAGMVTIDVADNCYQLAHDVYYTESTSYEYTL